MAKMPVNGEVLEDEDEAITSEEEGPAVEPVEEDAASDDDAEAEGPTAGDPNQASPEEQAQYERFVGRGMELIYSDEMFEQVVDMLDGDGEDPRKGLAAASSMIVLRVARAADEAGQQLSPDVVYHAGKELFEQLAEVSDKAGISNYANDPDALEGAFFMAIDQVIDQLAEVGELDQEGAKAQLAELQKMDQSGDLEKMFRDLDGQDGAQPDPAHQAKPAQQSGLKGGMVPRGM